MIVSKLDLTENTKVAIWINPQKNFGTNLNRKSSPIGHKEALNDPQKQEIKKSAYNRLTLFYSKWYYNMCFGAHVT